MTSFSPMNQKIMLQTTIFNITDICFRPCYSTDISVHEIDQCFEACVSELIDARSWLKKQFMNDIEANNRVNEEIYKDFYR